jgi:hypothetical protein
MTIRCGFDYAITAASGSGNVESVAFLKNYLQSYFPAALVKTTRRIEFDFEQNMLVAYLAGHISIFRRLLEQRKLSWSYQFFGDCRFRGTTKLL